MTSSFPAADKPQDFDPDRPTAVLIHGSGGSRLTYTGVARFAGRQVNALAVDLPGHGESQEGQLSSIEQYAAWLGRYLSDLAPPRPLILAGTSMGAAVALTTVINGQYPADGLVLIAAAASLWVEDELLDAARKDPAAAGWEMTQRMFAKSAPPIQVKTTYDFLMKLDPRVMIGDLEASRAFDARGRLAGVAVPALVVVGAEDQLTTPEDARDLADRLPHARLEVVEAAGHMIIVEKPRIVGRLIAEFAAGLLI